MQQSKERNSQSGITLIPWLFSVLSLFMLYSSDAWSQGRNIAEVDIKTSAQCPMCKESIEEMLTFERGVRLAVLDMETKAVTVRYNIRRTDPEKLRKAISKLGYDADDIEGDSEAYDKLPACCKKPDDPDHKSH